MGNANGGGSEPFRKETVISASYHQRNLNSSSGSGSSGSGSSGSGSSGSGSSRSGSSGSGLSGSGSSGFGKHAGVVVNTKEGNSYLVHHPGGNKSAVVTKASNMGKAWEKKHDIPVNGTKTVQEVFNAASGRTNNPLVNYVTAGTCIGSAKSAERALTKKE